MTNIGGAALAQLDKAIPIVVGYSAGGSAATN